MRGFSSTFTLVSSTAPSVSAITRSKMGPRVLQGQHQGAHRSTTTGTSLDRASTACSKLASVTSTMSGHPTRCPAGPMLTSSGGSVGGPAASVARMEPRGINQPNVTAWFEQSVPDVKAPLEFTLIAGGRSNLTFRVTDAADHEWALRRPPVSHVLPTAHDMGREYRVITALGPTKVPVPVTVGLCTDPDVNEQPFYVMEFVHGHILRGAAAMQSMDPAAVGAIGDSIADTLASLHAVDVEAVGLSDLARHEGYIERQIRRWSQQFHDMIVNGDDHGGIVERVGAELA